MGEEPNPSPEPISERSEFLTQQGFIVWMLEQRSQTREASFHCFAVGHKGRSPEPSLLQLQHTKKTNLKEAALPHPQQTGQMGKIQGTSWPKPWPRADILPAKKTEKCVKYYQVLKALNY